MSSELPPKDFCHSMEGAICACSIEAAVIVRKRKHRGSFFIRFFFLPKLTVFPEKFQLLFMQAQKNPYEKLWKDFLSAAVTGELISRVPDKIGIGYQASQSKGKDNEISRR